MDMPDFSKIIADKHIHCVDCNQEFTFTIGEQRYFLAKGLFEPKRCPICRETRKRILAASHMGGK